MENRRSFASLLLVLTVLSYATVAAGQTSAPLLINYQGELKSPTTGKPIPDGNYDMAFEIFGEATRGISLWQGHYMAANRNPVEAKNGLFSVILGSGAFVWADSTGDPLASTADNQFLVRAAGGVTFDVGDQPMQVNGELHADKIVYSSPRIHYYSVAAEDFIPDDSSNEYHVSNAGVYIKSASGTLMAPVHLPHGARVTGLNAFFYDDSDARIDVQFFRVPLGGGTPGILSAPTSEGISGYGSKFGSFLHVIDNTQNSYRIITYSSGWEGSTLRIIGAVITYGLEESL